MAGANVSVPVVPLGVLRQRPDHRCNGRMGLVARPHDAPVRHRSVRIDGRHVCCIALVFLAAMESAGAKLG